jgi:hypothetical protein
MHTLDQLVANYIEHANADYVGLWMIASRLKEDEDVKPDSLVKEKTLLIAQGLIKHDILPGYLVKGGGFNFWPGTPAEQLARISAEWPKQGIPTLATPDCWFALKK